MDLINKKVKHDSFGIGTITRFENNMVNVQFSSGSEKRFVYPKCFLQYLNFIDPDDQAAFERYIITQGPKGPKPKNPGNGGGPGKGSARPQPPRRDNKAKTFFVFQGGTFDTESLRGFIWAPKKNRAGNSFFHWENLTRVKKDDIVFHGSRGYIKAVSVATSDCFDCERPRENEFEDAWLKEGRRVDLKYYIFNSPLSIADFENAIKARSPEKHGPFNKDGKGNMGYLYELNRELAIIFLESAIKSNPDMPDLLKIKKALER